MPAVSICIPAFNRPAMLLDAARSVLAQSFEDLELVIIHDGPNPEIRECVRALADPRVRYLENAEPLGVPWSWNRCVRESRGEFVQILPDDDFIRRTFVEQCLARFAAHPAAGFVQTGGFNCDPLLRPVLSFTVAKAGAFYAGAGALRWQFKNHHCMPAAVLFRKSALVAIGLWRTDYFDDWAAIFKIAFRDGFSYVTEPLCGVRAHTSNYAKRLQRGGRDGNGDVYNQVLDVFGFCLPSTGELAQLLKWKTRQLGRQSAKAAVAALARGRPAAARLNFQRALSLNPLALLGPGILHAWLEARGHRKVAQMVRSGEYLSEVPLSKSG